MEFLDDDVSASEEELDFDVEEGADADVQELEAASDEDVVSDDANLQDPAAARRAPAAAAAGAGGSSSGPATSIEATQAALLSGELSAHAALLQLEVSELLSEVSLCRAGGRTAAVQQLVAALAAALARMPEVQMSAAADAGLAGFVSSLGLQPLDISLAVSSPVEVQLVGSWALGAAAAAGGGSSVGPAVVDVAVQMPSKCFHHKDHINYKYHAKRAMFIAAMSTHLANNAAFGAVQQQLAPLHGDPCCPALLLHLKPAILGCLLQQQQQQRAAGQQKQQEFGAAAHASGVFAADGIVLRLLPVIGLDTFELGKLAPDRNNVRWVSSSSSSSAGGGSSSRSSKKKAASNQEQQGHESEALLLPTPHYNASILRDMLLLPGNIKLQQAVTAAGTKFVDALLLLKVWAVQCGLTTNASVPDACYACYNSSSSGDSSNVAAAAADTASSVQADGFSGHCLTVLLLLAVQQAGSAAAAMTPVQLLRCALQLLSDKQAWSGKGLLAEVRNASVPVECRLLQQKEQQQQQQQSPAAATAAAAVPGAVSKDHARLVQKLQQQLQLLPAPAAGSDVFRKQYDVNLLDSSGHLNLAAAVSRSALQLAQQAAGRSLAVLSREDVDADVIYASLFRPRRGLASVFDYWWTVELPAPAEDTGGNGSNGSSDLPGDQHSMRLAEAQVEGLVSQALASRALLVKAIRRTPQFLKPAPKPPSATQQHQQQQHQQQGKPDQKNIKRFSQSAATIGAAATAGGSSSSSSSSSSSVFAGAAAVPRRVVVGAVVDAVAALRVVDVGPAADDAAAAGKFRALWGDKSELRRFPDGKINEAVVWEGVPPGERHRLPDLAVQHVLLRHLAPGTVVQSCSTALDPLLYPRSSNSGSNDSNGSSRHKKKAVATDAAAEVTWQQQQQQQESAAVPSFAVAICGGAAVGVAAAETAASRAADAALDSLSKQLRGLSDDVALKVISVQPLSSVTRHTCCFFPKPHPLADASVSGGVLEAAGKVPRVLEPIEVMVQLEGSGRMPSDPAAFAKMKAALGVQLATALSAACGASVTASEQALEVLWQGFAFKLLLYMDRDHPMLAAVTGGTAAAAAAAAAASSTSARSHLPRPVLLSRHHGLVAALEAAHAAYTPTVRLAKRWLGLQLLLGSQVSEEAVELLVGGAFQGPSSQRPPASRISGFLRFLDLVASHPWSAAPLLVDPSGEVGPAARRALLVEFEARRAAGTAPGMFLATPYDLHSSTWTSHHHPGLAVTHHLVSLARSACHQLSLLLLQGPDAPPAQQQLQLLQQGSNSGSGSTGKKKKKKQTADLAAAEVAADSAGAGDQQQGQLLVQLEMSSLAYAWRAATGAVLTGFDAWFLLRKEALPWAGRVDARALQQLDLLLALQQKQWQQLTAGAAAAGEEGAVEADGPKKQKKKRRLLDDQDGGVGLADDGGAGAGAGGAAAALQHLLLGGADEGAGAGWAGGWMRCNVPKESRAILRNIPEQLLATKPVDKLRRELLVGFNPISQLLQLCNERYGHLATFCADPVGCFPAMGLKWHPEALIPRPLRPALAQGMMVLGVTASMGGTSSDNANGGSKKEKKTKKAGMVAASAHWGLVVPNVPQVLAEVCELGAGMVQEVVMIS